MLNKNKSIKTERRKRKFRNAMKLDMYIYLEREREFGYYAINNIRSLMLSNFLSLDLFCLIISTR